MDDLSAILPEAIKRIALQHEKELGFPYPDVFQAIDIATRHGIAVLGVEIFEVQPEGLKLDDYSGYQIPFSGDWEQFVKTNNAEARCFVQQHPRGEDHAYILTAASKNEFGHL